MKIEDKTNPSVWWWYYTVKQYYYGLDILLLPIQLPPIGAVHKNHTWKHTLVKNHLKIIRELIIRTRNSDREREKWRNLQCCYSIFTHTHSLLKTSYDLLYLLFVFWLTKTLLYYMLKCSIRYSSDRCTHHMAQVLCPALHWANCWPVWWLGLLFVLFLPMDPDWPAAGD